MAAPLHHDVAVVGAGPAGAWAARTLASRGASVLLLDPSHPREKPCGGGVTARALALVADAVDLRTLPAVVVDSARFTASSTAIAADVSLPDGALVVSSRTEFDRLLLDAATRAGARHVPERVTAVRRVQEGFEIDTRGRTYRADFLVGADGANSLVRRKLSRPFRVDQLSIATGFFAHGATSRRIDLDLMSQPAGYLWSFPRPTHLAIGVCAQADAGSRSEELRRIVAGWIDRAGLKGQVRIEPYAWPIPSLATADLERLEASIGRCFLVGDAAGLVDPVTREGIYFALLSALWAADAICAVPSGGPGPWHTYDRRVRDHIGAELARAARLKATFFQPRFTRLLVGALAGSRSIQHVMADLVAGAQSYKGLRWRLARTGEIGLAARLFLKGPDRPPTPAYEGAPR